MFGEISFLLGMQAWMCVVTHFMIWSQAYIHCFECHNGRKNLESFNDMCPCPFFLAMLFHSFLCGNLSYLSIIVTFSNCMNNLPKRWKNLLNTVSLLNWDCNFHVFKQPVLNPRVYHTTSYCKKLQNHDFIVFRQLILTWKMKLRKHSFFLS